MKKSIFLFFAAILCATSAWAGPTFSGGYVYFHNKGGWNDSYKQLCIGKGTSGNSSYTSTYTMAAVKNTQLWYDDLPTSGWGDATYMAVIGNSSSWGPGNWGTANLKNATHRTKSASLGNWGFSKNHYQMLTPDNGNNDATLTLTWVGDNISAMNKTITVKAKVSTDKGATYAEKTSPGTLEASSFKFTDYKTCTTTTSLSSGKITCGYTANTTLTAIAATGYTFAGWYSGSTKISDNLSITVNPTGDVTYYAYYKANQYTVKFDANEGAGTMSDQSYTYDIEQALTANAFTRTGYTFEGWNTQADGTGTSYTDKQSVSNLSSTDGETITLYAQWEEIPANNHNITYTTQAAGWTYGTTPASAEEGTTVTFVVNPTTGYTVSVTSDDVTLNKNENEYTFTMPTKDVAINVSAVENTHNVIVSYKCGGETIEADATVEAVGEVTTISVTAPEIDGYAFDSWTLGSGIQSANTTANPISITTKASGDYTLTANYTKMVTVYLINNSNWARVYAYGWKNGEAQGTPAWPGAEITANKLAEKYEGYDVYSYKVEEGSYGKVIFNNGSGKQTSTFDWTDGNYYYAVDPLGSNVFLAGDMNEWNGSADELKKETAEGTTASIKVNLTAKTYEFKLVIDGAWKANTGTMQRGGQSVHEGGWSFDKDGYDDKCKLVADIAGDYIFTWDLTEKKLTVTYPALPKHQVTATVNPAETGEVTGTGEYEQGSKATLVATPAAGYAFKNWTVGSTEKSTEATYTFTVNEPISLVANFIPEVTKEVTISYLCNSNPIPGHAATTLAVGVTTPSTITAPAITNYAFDSWTVGNGVQTEDAATANPIHITTKAEGDYTLTANYTKIELTYTVTVPEGTEKCYIAGDMNSWSFQEMTPTANANEFTITIDGATTEHKYKYACQESWDYVELKADGSSVDDRTYNANDVVAKWSTLAKCYLMGNGDWVNGVEMEYDSKNGQYILLCHHIYDQFKFKYGDEWTTEVENYDFPGIDWVDDDHDDNYNITLPEGDYNFYFKKDSKKVYIEVSNPALSRTVPVGYYATVCLSQNIIKVVGATLFEVAGKDGNKVIFDEVLTPVAGMPYIFLAEENTISFYCGIETAATPGNHKSLHGTFEDMVDAELDGMYMVQNNKIVKCAATGCNIPKNRAYFKGAELDVLGVPSALMPGRRRITMGAEGENTTTGVEGIVVPEGQTIKVISNGQLIIIRNGEKFNAQGIKL